MENLLELNKFTSDELTQISGRKYIKMSFYEWKKIIHTLIYIYKIYIRKLFYAMKKKLDFTYLDFSSK